MKVGIVGAGTSCGNASVKLRQRCSPSRSASSARFPSVISVQDPHHLTMLPLLSRIGTPRVLNQPYSKPRHHC